LFLFSIWGEKNVRMWTRLPRCLLIEQYTTLFSFTFGGLWIVVLGFFLLIIYYVFSMFVLLLLIAMAECKIDVSLLSFLVKSNIVLLIIDDSQDIKQRISWMCSILSFLVFSSLLNHSYLHIKSYLIHTPTLPRLELGSLYCAARFRIVSICELSVPWWRHAFLQK
jgi:hypothetical protein